MKIKSFSVLSESVRSGVFKFRDSIFFQDTGDGISNLVSVDGDIICLPPQASTIIGVSEYKGEFLLSGFEGQVFFLGADDFIEGIYANVRGHHSRNSHFMFINNKKFTDSGIYDLRNGRIIFFKEKVICKFINSGGLWYSPDYSSLIKKDPSTAENIYSVDISKFLIDNFGEYNRQVAVYAVLGEFENILWVQCAGGVLLGLNPLNGEIMHQFREIPEFSDQIWHPEDGKIPDAYAMRLFPDKRKIMGIIFRYFWELDLETMTLSFYNLTPEFEPAKIACGRYDFKIENDIIWFLDQNNSKLGAIDYHSKKLIVNYSVPEELGVLMELESSNNHIYVRTGKGKLLAFEVEQ